MIDDSRLIALIAIKISHKVVSHGLLLPLPTAICQLDLDRSSARSDDSCVKLLKPPIDFVFTISSCFSFPIVFSTFFKGFSHAIGFSFWRLRGFLGSILDHGEDWSRRILLVQHERSFQWFNIRVIIKLSWSLRSWALSTSLVLSSAFSVQYLQVWQLCYGCLVMSMVDMVFMIFKGYGFVLGCRCLDRQLR